MKKQVNNENSHETLLSSNEEIAEVTPKQDFSKEEQDQLKDIVGGDVNEVSGLDQNNQEIISDVIIKERLEDVAQKTAPSKRKKSNITSLLLLAVNIVFVYFIASSLFKSADDASIVNLINTQGAKLNYLLYGLLLLAVIMIADALVIALILKATTGKFRLGLGYKASAIGKYYEAITPLSAGGQPAQIVYLAKRGVKPGIATSVPLIRVAVLNVMSILMALLMFVFVVPNVEASNGLTGILFGILEILAYIGFVINLFFVVAIIVIATSKTLGRNLARTIVKAGAKLHLIKDYRVAYRKLINQVAEYQSSINYLKKHLWLLISVAVLILIETVATASFPFIVSLGLMGTTPSVGQIWAFYLTCLARFYICYMASSFIPLPGGTGMMELSFVIMFSNIIGSNFVVWGFLIWRLLSYYSVIVQGFGITIGDMISGFFKGRIKTNK